MIKRLIYSVPLGLLMACSAVYAAAAPRVSVDFEVAGKRKEHWQIVRQCLPVLASEGPNGLADDLAIESYELSGPPHYAVIDLATHAISALIPEQHHMIGTVYISPDHEWIAYMTGEGYFSPKTLIVQSADGDETVYQESSAGWLSGWQDNDSLLIVLNSEFDNKRISVLDPFRGTSQMVDLLSFVASIRYENVWRGNMNAVFDPAMDRVIYPAGERGIVLADAKTNQIITTVGKWFTETAPRWSPDGELFVLLDDLSDSWIAGTASVLWVGSRDGRMQHGVRLPAGFYADSFSWSPDGKRIAFWADSQTEELDTFYILDLSQLEIMDTCLRFAPDWGDANPALWSADGKYLAVQTGEDKEITIVDIVDLRAYSLLSGYRPLGWLKR